MSEFRGVDRLIERGHASVELLLVDAFRISPTRGSGLESELEQVAAEQDRWRRPMLDAERARAFEEPVHRRSSRSVPGLRPSQSDLATRASSSRSTFVRQPAERAVADFVAHLEPRSRFEVLRGDARAPACERRSRRSTCTFSRSSNAARRRDALLLVIHRSNAPVDERRRRRLAEVVADRAEHDGELLGPRQIVDARARLIDHLQRVHPDVAFRVPLRLLRAVRRAPAVRETVRSMMPSSSAKAKPIDGRRREQQLLELAPDALWRADRRARCCGRSSVVPSSTTRSKRAVN
mgnify:CR=1 FL=1